MRNILVAGAVAAILAGPAAAVEIQWTDWQSQEALPGTPAGVIVRGQIVVGMETIDVTYENPQGIGFLQTGTGTDYWRNSLGAANSPYTSVDRMSGGETIEGVDNIPTASEMIALSYAGPQTLTFSKTVKDLVFGFISLNGNGYAFDQDFEILSAGNADIDGAGTDRCGYWTCGTSRKDIVTTMTGTEYQLNGTGEPHGALRFIGEFDTLTWNSASNEYWNGFTVGINGLAPPPPPPTPTIPLPATAWMLLSGVAVIAGLRARR